MARNGSGTYTFPSSEFNPAVSGATLTAASWNTLAADIEAAISASIASDGQTTCSARIPFAAGASATGAAASAVAYSRTGDANTGLYFPAADEIGLAAGGVAVLTATASSITVAKAATFSTAPTFSTTSTFTGVATFTANPIMEGVAPAGSDFDITFGNEVGTIDLVTERTGGNVGSLRIYGDNSSAVTTNYGAITSVITQNTSGDEYARLDFKAMRGGTLATGMFYKENVTNITSLELSSTENANFNLQSARSSDGDPLGYVQFIGKDSAAATTTYAQIVGEIEDNTDTTEDGRLTIRLVDAGTEADKLLLYTSGGTLTHQLKATANVANYYTSDRNTSNLVINWYQGLDSGSNVTNYAKEAYAVVDATDGSEDGEVVWATVGAGTLTDRMNLRLGMWMEGATGTDKGAGTINAVAVYDDNVLLTCYPFDAAIDGRVDIAKWDAKAPNRVLKGGEKEKLDENGLPVLDGKGRPVMEKQPDTLVERIHEGARRFVSRLGTEYDPLTTDGYAKHWKEKRHLTALPNEANFDPVADQLSTGEWLQRLIETVETQAILIEELNQRIKVLEA